MSSEVQDYQKVWAKNPMLKPFIDKLIINIGAIISSTDSRDKLDKCFKVLQLLVNQKPIIIKAKKNVKEWNVRVGQSIATKVTLRGENAIAFLKRALYVTDNRLLVAAFDNKGNFSFGIDEHIKIPNVKYDPDLGIVGFNVSVKIVRPGFRIRVRKKDRRKIGKEHYVSKPEAIYFMTKVIGAEVVEKIEERYY